MTTEQLKEVQAERVFELTVVNENGKVIATPEIVNKFIEEVKTEVKTLDEKKIKEELDKIDENKKTVQDFLGYSATLEKLSTEVMPQELKQMHESLKTASAEIKTYANKLNKVFTGLRQEKIKDYTTEAYKLIDIENKFAIKLSEFETGCKSAIGSTKIYANMEKKANEYAEEQNKLAKDKLDRYNSIEKLIEDTYEENQEAIPASDLRIKATEYFNRGTDLQTIKDAIQGAINTVKLERQRLEEARVAKEREEALKKEQTAEKVKQYENVQKSTPVINPFDGDCAKAEKEQADREIEQELNEKPKATADDILNSIWGSTPAPAPKNKTFRFFFDIEATDLESAKSKMRELQQAGLIKLKHEEI